MAPLISLPAEEGMGRRLACGFVSVAGTFVVLVPEALAKMPGTTQRDQAVPSFPSDTAPLSSPDPPPPADAKTTLRRHFRQQRRQALPAASNALITAAAARLPLLLEPPSRLGLYWPVGHEPDLRPLPDHLPLPWRERLALPAIRDDRLLYLPWRPGDPLAPDQVGIPAPTGLIPLEPSELGLLLVPALAVDHSGLRLGSGGGWYDRLRSDPRWAALPALVVVPDACVVPHLPRDSWDVPFPGWLTETGLHWVVASVATS